jgi:hypothetical protein
MDPEDSLLSQELATDPYSEVHESHPISLWSIPISSLLRLGLPSGVFP